LKFRVLKTIVLINALLLAFSAFASHVELPFLALTLNFKPLDKLLVLPMLAENVRADSLITSYISHEANASESGQPADSRVFSNPSDGNGFALDNFFDALVHESNQSVIRIAHYGDSQTEGDRISAQLRMKLQANVGGEGYGFVPLNDIATPVSYDRQSSENIIRYNVFSKRLSKGEHYGLSGCAFRSVDFTSASQDSADAAPFSDSLSQETSQVTKKHFSGSEVTFHFPKEKRFSQAFLLFGQVTGNTRLTITGENGALVWNGDLYDTPEFRFQELNKLNIPAALVQKKLTIRFGGHQATTYYGLYLDGMNGLQVDNYGLRGHSGDGLMLLDDHSMQLHLQYLDTRLIIFQYGGNSVPYVLNNERKEFVENMYSAIFMKFKRLMPRASILVIGVGDMAKSFDGEYRSYPGLGMVRDALRDAANNAHCAFWDLYEMMGGENSILKWAEKGLAAKDGHFSLSGERIVANELASHLLREFAAYKKRNNLP
jgi:hypothetical protein